MPKTRQWTPKAPEPSSKKSVSDLGTRPTEQDMRPIATWVGRTLGGKYKIERELAAGGMGLVLQALDENLDRRVAIKVILPELEGFSEVRAQFLLEAKAMARLRHPNVLEVLDFGDDDGTPYLVMPLHTGLDLLTFSQIRGGPPFSADVASGILGQACAGVQALHDAGVVHRDLKPRNIIVGSALDVVIADLGLARPMSAGPGQAPRVSGTPAFMAPEQVRMEDVPDELAPRADVYALGLIAFWLLTGKHPFAGSDLAILTAHVEEEPPPPSSIVPELSADIDRAIARALHKDPRQRTPSARGLREDLQKALLAARRSKPFIVVVDDDRDLLVWAASVLRDAFPHAELALLPEPARALALMENRPPSLAILDLELPAMNGLELTAILRGSHVTADVPVLIATGKGGAAEWGVCHQAGASAFLLKPLQSKMFIDTVARLLDPDDEPGRTSPS